MIKEDILKLLKEKPKHAVNMIFKNPKYLNLKNWVEENCDLISNTNATNAIKVYTAITGEKVLCPCGSGKLRKFGSFKRGLQPCGPIKSCSYNKKVYLEKRNKTNLQNYGFENPFQSPEIKDKIKKTNLERYGVENPNKSPEIRNKIEKTNIERYGASTPFKNEKIKNKIKQSLQNKYGVFNISQVRSIQDKVKSTNIERYGVSSTLQVKEVLKKIKQTNLEKYGSENPNSSLEVREKIRKTNLERYGTPYPMQNSDLQKKIRAKYFEKYKIEYAAQSHFSEMAKKILFNKNDLEKALSENSVASLSKILNVSPMTIYRKHDAFDLNIIKLHHSSYELEIANWLSNNQVEFIQNYRKLISPLEVDFYLPNYNLAIEFDGLYWHSEGSGKDKNYHLNKYLLCKEKNVRLIQIFEDEWLDKKEICQDIISKILGFDHKKIMARKCQIKEIDNKEAKIFLNKNHLQGYVAASINIGLYYNNKLVQLMTFKKARFNKNAEYELIRFSNLLGTTIIGGSDRLWINFLRKYNPKSIVTYCDKRWFVGNVYEKLGFIKIKENRINYWYTNGKARWHRSLFTKKKCVKKALDISCDLTNEQLISLTEKYIAKEIIGLDRIWDSGQDTWLWKNI